VATPIGKFGRLPAGRALRHPEKKSNQIAAKTTRHTQKNLQALTTFRRAAGSFPEQQAETDRRAAGRIVVGMNKCASRFRAGQ